MYEGKRALKKERVININLKMMSLTCIMVILITNTVNCLREDKPEDTSHSDCCMSNRITGHNRVSRV